MIVKVALLVNGFVLSLPKPARHDDLVKKLKDKFSLDLTGKEKMGFLTDKGDFLDRKKAYHHALKHGQIKKGITEILVSEDIW